MKLVGLCFGLIFSVAALGVALSSAKAFVSLSIKLISAAIIA